MTTNDSHLSPRGPRSGWSASAAVCPSRKTSWEGQVTPRYRFTVAPCVVLLATFLIVSCRSDLRLTEGADAEGLELQSSPVVFVGQILSHREIGKPFPSRFDPTEPMQLFRITATAENVLRGGVLPDEVEVYYLKGMRMHGPPQMGVIGRGGHWRIGDRLIFFLRRDSGVLRTVIDTWALPTVPVLTGGHPGYRPRTGESVEDSVIDILLDRGQHCGDECEAAAVSHFGLDYFDLAYAVEKLRQIGVGRGPEAAAAAKERLEVLGRSWPKIKDGWPEAGGADLKASDDDRLKHREPK